MASLSRIGLATIGTAGRTTAKYAGLAVTAKVGSHFVKKGIKLKRKIKRRTKKSRGKRRKK